MRRGVRILLLISAPLSAYQPASFKTAAQLVEINIVVRDRHGPIANLTQDDFTIRDAGKPRAIAVFSSVSSHETATAAPAPLAANTFSNRAAQPGSVTVILLDRLNTLIGAGTQAFEEKPTWLEDHALANARQHLLKFVATLDPNDRVAIYSLGKSLSVLSDFTGDRERLRTVLENYRESSLTKREDVDPQGVHIPVPGAFSASIDRERQIMAGMVNRNRAETTLGALNSIADHVASIRGRKNLVWLTANLPFSVTAAAKVLNRANVAVYPIDARGLLTRTIDAGHVDSAAQEVFGPVRRGATAPPTIEPVGVSSMQDMAFATGGRASANSNDLETAMREAVSDAAITYTLGFYVDTDSVDGAFHELRVQLRKKIAGAEIRAPKGYYALGDGAVTRQGRLLEAMVTPLESSGVGLLARVERSRNELVLTSTIDLRSLALERGANGWRGAAELHVVQQDGSGQLLDEWQQRMELQLTDA